MPVEIDRQARVLMAAPARTTVEPKEHLAWLFTVTHAFVHNRRLTRARGFLRRATATGAGAVGRSSESGGTHTLRTIKSHLLVKCAPILKA